MAPASVLMWPELLDLAGPPMFLAIGSEAQADDLVRAVPVDSDAAARAIRGRRCQTTNSLDQEMAAALQFPGYFGHNWWAMMECVTDLEWLPASAYAIFITDIDRLLDDEAEQFNTFMSILKDAVHCWANHGNYGAPWRPLTRFCVVFHTREHRLAVARQRLADSQTQVFERTLPPSPVEY